MLIKPLYIGLSMCPFFCISCCQTFASILYLLLNAFYLYISSKAKVEMGNSKKHKCFKFFGKYLYCEHVEDTSINNPCICIKLKTLPLCLLITRVRHVFVAIYKREREERPFYKATLTSLLFGISSWSQWNILEVPQQHCLPEDENTLSSLSMSNFLFFPSAKIKKFQIIYQPYKINNNISVCIYI